MQFKGSVKMPSRPHMGSTTPARLEMVKLGVMNLIASLSGKTPPSQINPEGELFNNTTISHEQSRNLQ